MMLLWRRWRHPARFVKERDVITIHSLRVCRSLCWRLSYADIFLLWLQFSQPTHRMCSFLCGWREWLAPASLGIPCRLDMQLCDVLFLATSLLPCFLLVGRAVSSIYQQYARCSRPRVRFLQPLHRASAQEARRSRVPCFQSAPGKSVGLHAPFPHLCKSLCHLHGWFPPVRAARAAARRAPG